MIIFTIKANDSSFLPLQFRKEYHFETPSIGAKVAFPQGLGIAEVMEHVFYERPNELELLISLSFSTFPNPDWDESHVPMIKEGMAELNWKQVDNGYFK